MITAGLANAGNDIGPDNPVELLQSDDIQPFEQPNAAALSALRDRGVGIVHVTHHLEDVLRADRAVVLDRGIVVFEGRPLELADDLDRARELGVDVPSVIALARALRDAGAPVPPEALTAEDVVEALWHS